MSFVRTMPDLMQFQIKKSCKLALPDGLHELMSDISREVLRAQPPDLYDFITKYLAALLVSRENLSIACRICQDVCDPSCHPELEDALRNIGMNEEDAVKAKEIIEEYFEKGGADEDTLMTELVKRTSITTDQLQLMQETVRDAFLQHHINNTDQSVRKVPKDVDEISCAATHTLQLYAKTGPSDVEYRQKAEKIQTAYRAYGVRRLCTSKPAQEKKDKKPRFLFNSEAAQIDTTDGSTGSMSTFPSSSLSFYDPENFNKIHETPSQMSLDVEREASLLSQVHFDEPRFVKIMSQELPDIIKRDDSLSLNEEKQVSEVQLDEPKSKSTNLEVKISFIPEVLFYEVDDKTPKQSIIKSSTEGLFNEELQCSNHDLDLADSKIDGEEIEASVDDLAIYADVESEASVEESIDSDIKIQEDFASPDDISLING